VNGKVQINRYFESIKIFLRNENSIKSGIKPARFLKPGRFRHPNLEVCW
jgi:hypothetical protein